MFRSPAQVAAEAAAPPNSVITAQVERGGLAESTTLQSLVQPAAQESVAVRSPAAPAVVTESSFAAAGTAEAGDVVLEVNNEPVFALSGSFPFFRDMTVGDSGRDVAQLQKGLRAAGLEIVVDGEFGDGTARAVTELYERAGYPTPTRQTAESSAQPDEDSVATSPGGSPQVVAPASAFAVASALPAMVSSAPPVGELADDAVIVFATGEPVAVSHVMGATAAALKKGDPATAEVDGHPVSLTLSDLSSADDKGEVSVVFTADEASALVSLLGSDTVVTVTRQIITAEALLVPSAAVISHGDSRSVLVKQGPDEFVETPVREIGALNGTSAIRPVTDGALTVGDVVRVK